MDQHVAFARDIRPLFNARDVNALSARFDLSSYDDVRERGANMRELVALTGETLDALRLTA